MKTKTSKTSKQPKQAKRTVPMRDLKAKKNAKGGTRNMSCSNNLKQLGTA